jgi:hypothetical protein
MSAGRKRKKTSMISQGAEAPDNVSSSFDQLERDVIAWIRQTGYSTEETCVCLCMRLLDALDASLVAIAEQLKQRKNAVSGSRDAGPRVVK